MLSTCEEDMESCSTLATPKLPSTPEWQFVGHIRNECWRQPRAIAGSGSDILRMAWALPVAGSDREMYPIPVKADTDGG